MDKHPYELYLQLNEIEHTKTTKAKSPQTNGICERIHQTILSKFYRVVFRKKIYSDLALQMDLDEYMNRYNNDRTHKGKHCQGRNLMETFLDGKKHFVETNLNDRLVA